MAIVQISQIQQRKGLQVDLPNPLAGAEFGWSTDTRQLWIGNGTLAEGAPVVGNTEILTEFSDIVNVNGIYTYKGAQAGYTVQTGPTVNDPVSQSLQTWMDQFATVKDFGAKGDGVTDDTDAINRALQQLYCIPAPQGASATVNQNIPGNPARRSLYFPAGVYLVTGTILIPPYAQLYGDGADSSVIYQQVNATSQYVAQTCDSAQQTGANILTNGALAPGNVNIMNMGFESGAQSTVFLIDNASDVNFTNCIFWGQTNQAGLTDASVGSAGIEFNGGVSKVSNINISNCLFQNLTWGIYDDIQSFAVNVSNSSFYNLYQGIYLAEMNSGEFPTGFRILQNSFDNVYDIGVFFNTNVTLCATINNVFYNVGNHNFTGTPSPASPCIVIDTANNVSLGDLFQRVFAPGASITYPAISAADRSITMTSGQQLQLGTQAIDTGTSLNVPAGTSQQIVINIGDNNASGFVLTYSLSMDNNNPPPYGVQGGPVGRNGTLTVSCAPVPAGGSFVEYSEDYVENYVAPIYLTANQSSTTVSVFIRNAGTYPAIFNYSVSYFLGA